MQEEARAKAQTLSVSSKTELWKKVGPEAVVADGLEAEDAEEEEESRTTTFHNEIV